MSKELSQVSLFDHNDWNNASRNDRIYMSIVDGTDRFVLTADEQAYANKMERAFVIISEIGVFSHAVKMIMETEKLSRGKAMRLIEDMESVYGRFRKVNKEFERNYLRDRAKKVLEKCKRLSKPAMEIKVMNFLLKLDKLDVPDTEDEQMYDTIQPPDVIYTENPSDMFEEAEVSDEEE